MKIHTNFDQSSLEWLSMRAGKVTASEMDALVSPKGKVRDGQMPNSYLDRKLAEARLGVLPSFNTISTEYGSILEDEAIPFYELTFPDSQLQRVGFIASDDGRCGCSPDAILGDDSGLELKCPSAPVHVGYLRGNRVPDEHILQVQFSMFITGRTKWRFMSYHRRMPPLVVDCVPDENIQKSITAALKIFFTKYDDSIGKLSEMAGEAWKRDFQPKPTTPEPADNLEMPML